VSKKLGLTFERHQEIGRILYNMHNELTRLTVEVGNAYPATGKRGKQLKELRHTIMTLNLARCWLDSRLFEDCPDEARKEHVYYHPSEGKRGL